MLEDFNCTTKDVTTVVSTHSSCFGLAVLFSPWVIERFPLRYMGMAGASILVSGNLIAAFATSFTQLLLGISVLHGIGFGFIIVATLTNFNHYFDNKRTVAMSLSQVLNMGGTTLYPLIVETLLVQYGYFGTHLILAAMSAHAIFSMVLIRPNEGYTVIKNIEKSNTPIKETNGVEYLELGRSSKYENLNLPGSNTSWWRKVTGSRHMTFLKDPRCLNMCFGVAFTMFIDPTFFAMQTVYLLGPLGMSVADAKVILTVTSAGDLLARISTMLFGKWLSTKNRSLFWFAMTGTAIGVVCFALVQDYIALLVFSAILGYFRGIIWVTQSLVYSEHYNNEDFPIVFSLSTVILTVANLSFGPLIGMIRDYTNSFLVMFMVMAGVLFVASALWLADLIAFRCLKTNAVHLTPGK